MPDYHEAGSFIHVPCGEVAARAKITFYRIVEIQEEEDRKTREKVRLDLLAKRSLIFFWRRAENVPHPTEEDIDRALEREDWKYAWRYPSTRSAIWKKRAERLYDAASSREPDAMMLVSAEDYSCALMGWGHPQKPFEQWDEPEMADEG